MTNVKILALLVFITGFIRLQGHKVTWKRDLTVHKFHAQQDQRSGCNPILTEFLQNRKDSKCQPRKTIISINTGDPDYIYEPTHLTVKKCSGTCKDQMSCIADEKKISKFSVHRVSTINSASSECGFVEVEEDINCQCSCTMTENSCNMNQMYEPEYCMCKCMKDKDMTEECEKSGRLWDPARCDCYCKDEEKLKQGCSSMQYFNRMKCKCVDQHDI